MTELVAHSRQESWGQGTRFAFRFAFCFFVLENLPFPLTQFPVLSSLVDWYTSRWVAVYGWVGRTVLGLSGFVSVTTANGSGDRLQDWVGIFTDTMVALLATLIWSTVDRRRPSYRTLYRLVRVFLRYALATALLTYGLMKVIKDQMPSEMERMIQPYGQSSPMGLLWTLMGESTPYELFSGACETLAGLLLLWRRTATVGALVAAGVMANVVALNFMFDVPVKIYSSTLLVTALFLLVDDAGRLVSVFFFQRATAAVELGPDIRRRWLCVARWIVKPAFIGWTLYSLVSGDIVRYFAESDGAPIPEVHGIFEVVEFERDGKVVPPTLDEPTRWKRLAFDKVVGGLLRMDDIFVFFGGKQDAKAHTLDVRMRGSPAGRLIYELGAGGEITLSGFADRGVLRMRLRPSDPRHNLLQTRGFHWVNESPFNQ